MHDAFHVPLWLWVVALAVVLAVAAAAVASRSRGREPGLREAALCTAAGSSRWARCSAWPWRRWPGRGPRGQFYAGWLTEYSLSLDNLFVFVLLIGRSARPCRLRSRVLLAGIWLGPAAAGRVHRGGRRRPEPLRLGDLNLRRGAAGHRGPDGRGPRRPAKSGGRPAPDPRSEDASCRAGLLSEAAPQRRAAGAGGRDRRRRRGVREYRPPECEHALLLDATTFTEGLAGR